MDDLSRFLQLPLSSARRSAAVDAERIRAALEMIDALLAPALRAATYESIGRVMLGKAVDIAAGNPEVVPTADQVKEYVITAVAARIDELVGTTEGMLEALTALSEALGNDPNFATTITSEIAKKADRAAVDAALDAIHGALAQKIDVASSGSKGREVLASETGDQLWEALGRDASKLLQRIEVATNVSALVISIPSDTKILKITGGYTLTSNASVYNGMLLRFSTNGGVSYLSGPTDYFMSSYQVRSGAILVGKSDEPNMAVSARAAVPHVPIIFTSHITLAPAGAFPAMKSQANALDSAGEGQYQFFGAGFCRTGARVTNLMLVPADGSFIQPGSLFVFEGDRA